MSKKVKIILGAFLALIILAVAGITIAYNKRDRIIQVALEKILSDQMAVAVTIAKVNLDVKAQSIQISGLSIGNPEGYKSKEAIRINDVFVNIDLASFSTMQPHITMIRISEPQVTMEYKGLKTNLGKIMDNLDKEEAEAEEVAANTEEPSAESKQYIIDSMEILKSKSSVIVPATVQPISVTMPDVKIKNLGGENKTWTISRSLKFFLTQLVMGTLEYGTDLPGEFVAAIGNGFAGSVREFKKYGGAITVGAINIGKSAMKGSSDAVSKSTNAVKEGAKAVTQGAGKTIKGGANAIKEGTKGITKGVKDLLGGDKEKNKE